MLDSRYIFDISRPDSCGAVEIRAVGPGIPAFHLHRDHIETKGAFPQAAVPLMHRQPHLRHAADLILLAGANRFEWLAVAASEAGLYLDESDKAAAAGDDVDLTVAAAIVGLEDQIALLFDVAAGERFTGISVDLAIVGAVKAPVVASVSLAVAVLLQLPGRLTLKESRCIGVKPWRTIAWRCASEP